MDIQVNYVAILACGISAMVIGSIWYGPLFGKTWMQLTGKKMEDKRYYRHSQYPGGLKSIALGDQQRKNASRVIEHAVKGMLPHTPLGRAMLRRLKVYPGPDHPHTSQTGQEATT